MKVLVTGTKGQLGQDAVRALRRHGHTPIAADMDDFDITNEKDTRAFFAADPPDAVLHCAAYTAVDRAESEAELCRKINADGTRNVAEAAESCGAKMIYISTDYVYGGSGSKPLTEDMQPNPLNVYGKTKLLGEIAAQTYCSRLFIVRTSWVFGLHGGNFIKTMLRLGQTHDTLTVVDDQVGSPTFTEDLAELLCAMLETERYGTYNATNDGFCSWCDFAREIFRRAGQSVTVLPVTTEQYGAPALRPKNSRLSKQKLIDAGFSPLPHWSDALDRFLAGYTAGIS